MKIKKKTSPYVANKRAAAIYSGDPFYFKPTVVYSEAQLIKKIANIIDYWSDGHPEQVTSRNAQGAAYRAGLKGSAFYSPLYTRRLRKKLIKRARRKLRKEK